MITCNEYTDQDEKFSVSFPALNDIGGQNQLVEALKKTVTPDAVTKEEEHGWHFSEVHYSFVKDKIRFSVDFDESNIVSLTLHSANDAEAIGQVRKLVRAAVEDLNSANGQ